MCECKVLLILAIIISVVTTFNVDNVNYATYSGPDDWSMFGFSVAIHKEHNNGWLIVGAPEAESGQPGVIRGGAVYMCPTERDGGCIQIPFDRNGDNYDGVNRMDNKTAQWFGATVSASGSENGPVVACAPRYTWFPKSMTRRDPVGTCYVARDSFQNFEEYAPCRTFLYGYHRQGSCQAGFSAAIDREGSRLFIGAPGSYYWQGQMYSVDAHAKFKFKPVRFNESYGGPGQIIQQSLSNRATVFQTQIGPERDDDSYKGYSSVVGDFTGEGQQGVAVGMPKANDLKGRVLLYTWNLTTVKELTSDQLGSYFGYALATADIDGDRKVDLIIGSPLYTLANTEMKYDVGRVYIFYQQSKEGYFERRSEIDGFNSKSRFGQAVAGLGDINLDGYQDFAIGAPYDGDDERGCVYIYHGSSTGVMKTFSQVIRAQDIIKGPTGALTTFGFSLTGGMDLDGNEYPDMAVGAYLSNKAFFFRSRPVVTVDASFTSSMDIVDIKDYEFAPERRNNGFNLTYCVKYHGKGIPDRLEIELEFLLDTKTEEGRLRFSERPKDLVLVRTVHLIVNAQKCDSIPVYVRKEIRNKLSPMEVEMKYSLRDQWSSQQYVRDPRSVLHPVLDLTVPPSRSHQIMIQNNCGADKVCTPDLQLIVKSNHYNYLIGNTEPLSFDIYVGNVGEDSFGSTLFITYPENIFFKQKIDKKNSATSCTAYETNKTVICDIGNPIQANEAVTFDILWQHDYVEGMLPHFDFYLKVNSTSDELKSTLHDNEQKVTVKLWGDSTLNIRGQSEPNDIYFNASLYTVDISSETLATVSEKVIGPQVTHIYYLKNEGVTKVNETEIYLIWPSETLGGETLLYLVDEPYFIGAGDVVCDHHELINPKGFTRDDREEVLERVAQYMLYQPELSPGSSTPAPPVPGGSVPIGQRPSIDDDSGDSSTHFKFNKTISSENYQLNISKITWVGTWGIPSIDASQVHVNIDYSSTGKGVAGSTDLGQVAWGELKCYDLVGSDLQEVPCVVGSKYEYYRAARETSGGQVSGTGSGCLVRNCFNEHSQPITCGSQFQIGYVRYGYVKSHILNEVSTSQQEWNANGQGQGGNQGQGGQGGNQGQGGQWGSQGQGGQWGNQGQGGSWQIHNETHSSFSSKCYEVVDGQQHEVECKPGFNVANIDYKCYEEIDGTLKQINCQSGSTYRYFQKLQNAMALIKGCYRLEGNRRYQIDCGSQYQKARITYNFQQTTGQSGNTINFINRCYSTLNGVKTEVDCNSGNWGGFSITNPTYRCFEDVNDRVVERNCESGRTYHYYQEGLGTQSSVVVLIIGCYRDVGGQRLSVSCEPKYKRLDITYTYKETVIDGGTDVHLQNKCYQTDQYGTRKEVPCGSDFFTNSSSLQCYDISGGRRIEVPCTPGVTVKPPQSEDDGTVKVMWSGKTLTFLCYSRGTNTRVPCTKDALMRKTITYKCFEDRGSGLIPVSELPGGILEQHFNIDLSSVQSSQNWSSAGSQSSHFGSSGGQYGSTQQGSSGSGHYQGSSQSGQGATQGSSYGSHQQAGSQSGSYGSHQQGGYQSGSYGSHQQGGSQSGSYGSQQGGSQSGSYGSHQQGGAQTSQGSSGGQYYGTSRSGQSSHGSSGYYGSSQSAAGSSHGQSSSDYHGSQQGRQSYGTSSGHGQGSYGSYDNRNQNGQAGETYEDEYYGEYEESSPNTNQASNNRDPHSYGQYGGSENQQSGGQAGGVSPLGQGLRVVTVDLGNSRNTPQRTSGHRTEHRWEETHEVPQTYGNSLEVGRDNVATDRPDPNPNPFGRRKRSVSGRINIEDTIKCSNVKCSYMTCKIGALDSGKEIIVALRARLNARIPKSLNSQQLTVSSVLASRVSKLPFVSEQPENQTLHAHEILTNVPVSVSELKPDVVPLWVVVLSAVAGTIILLLLILLLYKLGFFKRNRPSNAPERQPLNRNGYNHGDEAL